MNIWEVHLENANWEANPWQTIKIATRSMDIVEAINTANCNFPSSNIIGIKHIGFAHLTEEVQKLAK